MANTLVSRAAVIGIGVMLLASCGGDTPEELQAAVANAGTTVDYAQDDEGTCIGNALYETVGFDTLTTDGNTVELLRLDSAAWMTQALSDYTSESLDEAIADCLNVDERFRAELSAQHLDQDISCATPFDLETPLVADYVAAVIDGEDTTISIDDNDSMRDLLRPCTTDDDFASVFGLQTADELASLIDEEYGDDLRLDEQPCAGGPIVDTVGFEVLNDTGIAVDGAQFTLSSLDLEDGQLDSLLDEIEQCADLVERTQARYRTQEPAFGPCVVETVESDDEWRRAWVEYQLGVRTSDHATTRAEDRALDDCLAERIVDAFGKNDPAIRFSAFEFGDDLYLGGTQSDPSLADYGATEAEFRCMTYGLFDEVGTPGVYEIVDNLVSAEEDSLDFWEAYDQLWDPLNRANRKCVGDWLIVASDIERWGFADETLDCVRVELVDIEEFAAVMTATTSSMTDDEYWDYVDEFDSWIFRFDDALEGCYIDGERDLYDDYNQWRNEFDGYDFEDDLTLT